MHDRAGITREKKSLSETDDKTPQAQDGDQQPGQHVVPHNETRTETGHRAGKKLRFAPERTVVGSL